jgi:uncharacterized protein (TIGR03067 family)
MRRLILAVCGLFLGAGITFAGPRPALAQAALQGSWVATEVETDGTASPEIVGHRLSFSGNRFEIRSKNGKKVYAGTVRTNPKATPAANDFVHSLGALSGRTWKGIYKLEGDTLIVCDNAADLAKGRPTAFEAKSGSGYVLLTFARAK